MDIIDDHESYHVKIVKRERMVLTSVQTIYIRRNVEPKSVWRKLHTIEQSERELIGEAKEERQIMSGSFIKDKYEKPVSIRRKRQRPMDSPVIDQKRRQGDDRTTEQLNTSSNSFLQSNDKENSILDEILVPETQQQSQGGQVHQPNPSDFSQIFDDEPSHPSGNRSTPLKVLSPNKRVSAIETPQKGLTPTKLNSPVIKNQVVKNLERSAIYESPSRAKVDPPRVKLTPSPKKKLHLTPKKIITPKKPSTSGLPTTQESNQTLEFSLDDTPVRPWNADSVTAHDQNFLNRSRERWKQLKMLDQSSHSSTHCPIIEELDETNQSLISPNESLEPELAAPEMPKLPESRTLKLDTLVWSQYGDGYYPAYVREILDPRSPKVKVSFCDQEMADVVMSVNINECLLFQDLTKQFERLVPVMARNVDSKSPHLWADVQIHDYWGMRNHNLSTDEGRQACSTTAGYMVKYNHSVFKLVPFSDVAIKKVEGIDEKFKDYKAQRLEINTHNLPDMVTANIIATPRRKRGVVTNSPLTVKTRPADKYLEGIYFVFMRKSHSFTKEQYDSILKGITDVGGRIISDINAFDMKSIRKHEEIYCISEQEKATPRYLTCLVYQIQTCRPKWIEDMLKKKHYIQPESSPKLYVLREKKKYKDKLFKNTTFHLAIQSPQEEAVAAQLVLNNGASVTQLNGKDYFRHEGQSSAFIYVSDGSSLIQPEKNTTLVNLNWLLESVLQAKFLKLEKYPVDENHSV